MLVLLGLAGGRGLQAAERPNIVFILTDDQATGMTGFEGHRLVRTPNLDRLAAEGVHFTRAYTVVPQCAPSRATILTGQYPHTHGVGTNGDTLETDAVTFSALLKEAGYACGIVGKWHLKYEDAKRPGFGFEDYIATDRNDPEPSPEQPPIASPAPPAAHLPTAARPPVRPVPAPAPRRPEGPVDAGPAGHQAHTLPADSQSHAGFAESQPHATTVETQPHADPAEVHHDPMLAESQPDESPPAPAPEPVVRKKWSWTDCPVFVNGEERTADKYLTDWHGDRAIEFIEKFHGRPFFLWLCFRAPHAPLEYPPGTEDLYPPASVDLPENMQVPPSQRPRNLMNASPVQAFNKERANLREARSKYYAMITRIDENVGRVLARLDELNLRENTVVVFASDNGWCLGEHGLYAKGPFFYEALIRTPLVVRVPGQAPAGTRIDRIVSLVDLAPTFLDLAGVPVPMVVQGESLMPLLRDPGAARWADERFLEYEAQDEQKHPARGIVTEQFKLIDYLQGSDADDVFYDLKRDPQETYNLIQDKAYAPMVRMLRSRLDAWRRQTKDPTRP